MKAKKALQAKQPLKANAKPKTKQKRQTVAHLKKEADKWFSKTVRLRFAERVDGVWWAECVTCKARKPISKLQCGHFMSRQFNNTRYDEENCACQCYGCNVMQQGRQYEFGQWVDEFYGEGTAKKLHEMSKAKKQFTVEELQEIIADAKEQISFYEKQV